MKIEKYIIIIRKIFTFCVVFVLPLVSSYFIFLWILVGVFDHENIEEIKFNSFLREPRQRRYKRSSYFGGLQPLTPQKNYTKGESEIKSGGHPSLTLPQPFQRALIFIIIKKDL